MTGEQIRALEGRLWKSADELRANSKLTATEYSFTVLGIIFLRHEHKDATLITRLCNTYINNCYGCIKIL